MWPRRRENTHRQAMTLLRPEYGREGTRYVRAYLDSNERFGKRLGPLLAERDIEAGTVRAYVPPDSSAGQRTAFVDGGLFAPRTSCDESGSQRTEVRAWLSALLAAPTSAASVLCVEDPVAQRGQFRSARPRFHVLRDDGYWYATEKKLRGLSLEWIPLGGGRGDPESPLRPPCPLDRRLVNRRSVSADALESMAASAVAVIVGAWDGEGVLVWEPPVDSEGARVGRGASCTQSPTFAPSSTPSAPERAWG